MNKFTLFLFIIGIVLVSGCTGSNSNTGDAMENIVKEGDYVKVDYIGELKDGTIFDTSIKDAAVEGEVYNPNREYEPLGFTVGAGQMIAGFDKGVIGMAVGEEKTLTLTPEEAYGEYSEERIQTVSLEELESVGIFPTVGDKLSTPQGFVTVVDVTDTEVKIDYNHELAGKTLIFKVTLVSIGQE
ncbi:MAG: peptidylprolyl isomerase [Methanosarcinaceae archaeon]|nr:peptidylprolyl isomerase [Methanosarcinaceae archaeon]MDF1534488.1 peptidylprolyl isomerase [Methanosarcinaceae archaeon]